ncbi:MAG: alkaline phosphatase family protein [Bacteroidetes bacterium]|nr:alkaline phosphatase family protein [Bacteroidota bacterium]
MKLYITVFILILSLNTFSQSNKKEVEDEDQNKQRFDETAALKPKLVIGIVVDQMRNDFIYRYWNRFSDGGFRKLINEGYYFKNTHYNYIPTYTGPGHCSIYTGATPRAHGIIANEWYDKKNKSSKYCVYDADVKSVGTENQSGMMSPKNQLSSTIGDELKITSNNQGKVFAVALKDRSAVLPAGHAANGAFWLDEESGNFVTSNWYMKELPQWLKTFNEKAMAKKYLAEGWNTFTHLQGYTASIADDNNYESVPNKKDKPVFPYSYKDYLQKNQVGIIRATPFGNSLTKDVAIECIKNEQLGKDNITDLFSISFSSTDIIAHSYGPRSVEVEDTYLRLDKDIEEILNVLDKEVGKNNYIVFLTADHGGGDVPNHLIYNKIPAGYLAQKHIKKELKTYLKSAYGDTLLLADVSNEQVFLNEIRIKELKLNINEVEENVAIQLLSINGIAEAYPSKYIKYNGFEKNDYKTLLQNGYNHAMSGNVCFIFRPAWMDYAEKGTTHGAAYNYDTHVPLLFYGKGIKKGVSFQFTTITQIAPTICELLQLNQPNATVAEPLNSFFK